MRPTVKRMLYVNIVIFFDLLCMFSYIRKIDWHGQVFLVASTLHQY